ncbi:RNA polymerase subunit sigma [Radiobacillus kanasensis]|uniref:sigma factor-like helix-turn-helix DNA-binding protein n=1 Tax=Radiobacillus kanasensis TaxID=2844358 RepID=UPI001E62C3EF|nr:sigma factor-like helix-turn-helix DNA-binding protein [Radiobacillus kanasensis]UFT98319.1 RNA polymerase subunit sigma [Radiobacillus kanasensis]
MYEKLNFVGGSLDELEGTRWEEHYKSLLHYCRFITRNKWDSEEVAQESLVKAIEHYGIGARQISPALLKKIAYNNWIDTVRKRKREELQATTLSEEAGQHDGTSASQIVEILKQRFTPKQAVIFLLREAFAFRLKEIAELLETTEMAVKASYLRAKRRLEKEEDSGDFLSFWEEEEELSELVTLTIQNQEPTVLIQALPSIDSLKKNQNPTCKLPTIHALHYSSTHTLSLAA